MVFATGVTTSNIQVIGHTVAEGGPHVTNLLITAAALLLFGGTIGKSAQFPLYVWLPDAMAGPTPVSALIHAATMVAAGVYLVARMFEVFVNADPFVLTVVSVVGAITLLMAAFLALIQNDIKKVLAYSTISQLAYMVAALGLGEAGYAPAMFHLFTHAFFKALLFLGAGSVIHAVHSNDMREMGGLRKPMPTTFWTYVIGSLALAGIAPLSGFWSKDELLVAANSERAMALPRAAGRRRVHRLLHRAHGVHDVLGRVPGPRPPARVAGVHDGPAGAPGGRHRRHRVPGRRRSPGAPFFDWVFFGHPEEVSFVPWIAGLSTLVAVGGLDARLLAVRGSRARARPGARHPRLLGPRAQVLPGRPLHEGHRVPGPRPAVGRRVLVQPARARRRGERRGHGRRAACRSS